MVFVPTHLHLWTTGMYERMQTVWKNWGGYPCEEVSSPHNSLVSCLRGFVSQQNLFHCVCLIPLTLLCLVWSNCTRIFSILCRITIQSNDTFLHELMPIVQSVFQDMDNI